MKKKIFKLAFFLLVTIIMILVLVLNNDMDEVGQVIKGANVFWLCGALIILLVYLLINPLSLMIVLNDKNCNILDSYLNSSIEYFYNGITPSNTGAQPMQVIEYKRLGVNASKGTGALLINSLVNQIVIVVLCFLSLIYYKELSKGVTSISILITIGLIMNFLVLLLYLSIGISKTIRNWLVKVVNFFCNLKIFKGKLSETGKKFEQYCLDAQISFKEAFSHPVRITLSIFFKFLSLLVFYALPFFILRSLNINLSLSKIPLVIAMTTFSIAMTCFIPTPGASGGIEFTFKSLFINLAGVTSSIAVSGMILWRLLTYYLLMLISFILYIILEFRISRKQKKLQKEELLLEGNVSN